MGYQSARILVVSHVAYSMGVIQIRSADQSKKSFRHNQGIVLEYTGPGALSDWVQNFTTKHQKSSIFATS